MVQDFNLDTYKYKKSNNPKAQTKIKELIDSMNLTDIWREVNERDRKYTWHGPNSKMSRLDYFLISKNLEESVNKAEIKSGYRSDHSLITLAFTFINQPKGRGVWKFNNSLVGDIEYVNLVKKIILETKQQYCRGEYKENEDPYDLQLAINDQLVFEMLKLNIRARTIPYTAKKTREREQRERFCELELENLHSNLSQDPLDENNKKMRKN